MKMKITKQAAPAGAPANATLHSGYPQNGPTSDLDAQPKVPSNFGTQVGSTQQHPTMGWTPKRRNIKTNAK